MHPEAEAAGKAVSGEPGKNVFAESSPGKWCKSSALISSVKTFGGSGRLELRHLLLDLLVCVIVWSGEDERDRLGREITAAD